MPTELFLNLPDVPPGVPLWQHVSQSIMTLIRRGDLLPGQPLPSHSELCEQIGVSHVTMQRSLASLAREGWIVRHRRRGTFVAEKLPKLRDQVVAVIARAAFHEHLEGFDRLMMSSIRRVFQDDQQQFRFYPEQMDDLSSPAESGRLSLDNALINDIESGRVLGLMLIRPSLEIANHLDPVLRQRLVDHDVPVVAVNSWLPIPYAATTCCLDYSRFFTQALEIVHAAGRKRIGLLCQRQPEHVAESFTTLAWKAACDLGLESRVVGIPVDMPISEEAAFRTISDYLDRKDCKLDSLIISDDCMAKGVASALVSRGVSVPKSLMVVTQGSKGSGLTYPLPFIRVEFDVDQLVRSAWEQIQQGKRGFRSTKSHLWTPPESKPFMPVGT